MCKNRKARLKQVSLKFIKESSFVIPTLILLLLKLAYKGRIFECWTVGVFECFFLFSFHFSPSSMYVCAFSWIIEKLENIRTNFVSVCVPVVCFVQIARYFVHRHGRKTGSRKNACSTYESSRPKWGLSRITNCCWHSGKALHNFCTDK